MYKYEIIIYWSNEDDAYVAEVPELPGCMAHGNRIRRSNSRAQGATLNARINRHHPNPNRPHDSLLRREITCSLQSKSRRNRPWNPGPLEEGLCRFLSTRTIALSLRPAS